MRIYKYITSESALKSIVAGKIKFATLDSLNEPTELMPKIYESELLQSLKEKEQKDIVRMIYLTLKGKRYFLKNYH